MEKVNKRGSMSEHIPEILLLLAVLVIVLLSIYFASKNWPSFVEGIKNLFRFGK